MQRLRGSWLALLGAALLVLFSVSVAVGADPATSDNPGQSIAGFVHSLIFGEQAPDDEVTTDDESDEDQDEDADEDEDGDEEEATEDEDASAEEEQDGDASGAEHGACVAQIAQSDEVEARTTTTAVR
jgi:hypothetical protein